jgi:hypothetical protein
LRIIKKETIFCCIFAKKGFFTKKKRYAIKEFFETKVKPFLSRLRGRKKKQSKIYRKKKVKSFCAFNAPVMRLIFFRNIQILDI